MQIDPIECGDVDYGLNVEAEGNWRQTFQFDGNVFHLKNENNCIISRPNSWHAQSNRNSIKQTNPQAIYLFA